MVSIKKCALAIVTLAAVAVVGACGTREESEPVDEAAGSEQGDDEMASAADAIDDEEEGEIGSISQAHSTYTARASCTYGQYAFFRCGKPGYGGNLPLGGYTYGCKSRSTGAIVWQRTSDCPSGHLCKAYTTVPYGYCYHY